jgi:hypothetical protein
MVGWQVIDNATKPDRLGMAPGLPYRAAFVEFKRKEVTAMTISAKLIKAVVNFGKKPEQLLAQAQAVVMGLTGNEHFTNPPIDLNVFKTAVDAYSASIIEAQDGGKKAITSRNHQGESIKRMLRAIASYVELNCKEDMNIFLTSNLRPRSTARTLAQPLASPKVDTVEQGVSGELLVWIARVHTAKTYEVRYGPLAPDGMTPASWLTQTVPNTRTAASLAGLNPGTKYAIQVRAFGPLGFTEWSDYATRMCI